jgi:hypothetical protein
MNTNELVDYYANLLILQYKGKPKAYATIQAFVSGIMMLQDTVETITLSGVPASGTFVLSYDGVSTAAINWNDSVSTIQTKLRAISGLEDITVSGSLASKILTVTFTGVDAPAKILEIASTSLQTSAPAAISFSIEETDEILPLAVQNGYNLIGDDPAVGDQLDILGKYAGVKRTGAGFYEQITLSDSDFVQLIRMAIVKNNSSSSLGDIQELLDTFFPDQVMIFDTQLMKIFYYISSGIGSQELIQMFITQKIIPKPMGVKLSVILYVPDVTAFFGFRTYASENTQVKPFNSYHDHHTDYQWMSYHDAIIPP